MELKNQTVVITGGGSGLGAATAKYFAEAGAKIALFDVQEDKLKEVAKETGAEYFVCDVTSETSVQNAVDAAYKKLKSITVLVNCAGIAPGARIVGKEGVMPLADFKRVIDINLIGSFNVMRLVAEKMSTQETTGAHEERGVIINTASVAAYEGQIGQAAYAASKGGIVGLTLPAARELAKFGIRVMTIAPGLMETPMLAGMPEKVYQSLIETTLFPHRLGKAEEYAHLARAIVENPLLNGETIRLDGAIRLNVK